MDLQLQGKVVIVTGASRGIGQSTAQLLAREGAALVLAARSTDALAALAGECGDACLTLSIDLRATDAAETLVAAALKRFGRIDGLVNNAGATVRGDFLALGDDQWQDGFALKFFGAMRCCRAAWPALVASGGAIVNIAGVGGRTGSAEFAIGGSVNAAVLNLTKALADRGIADGVRVNAINPGGIATERLQTRIEAVARDKCGGIEAAAREMAAKLGIARFGQPEEVAGAIAFLLSPACAHLQGAILDIDGGQTRTL